MLILSYQNFVISDEIRAISLINSAGFLYLLATLGLSLFLLRSKITDKYNLWQKMLGLNVYLYLAITGISTGILEVSLRETPLIPPSSIRSDLGRHIDWALLLQETQRINYSYPPGYLIFLNALSFITGESIVDVLKPSIFILRLLAPVFLLLVYSAILPRYIAGTLLLITEVFTIYEGHDWKFIANFFFISLVLFLVVKNNNTETNDKARNVTSRVLHGALLGIFFLFYYSALYWFGVGIVVLILLMYISKNSKLLSERLFDVLLGFSLVSSGLLAFKLNFNQSLIVSLILMTLSVRFYSVAKNILFLRNILIITPLVTAIALIFLYYNVQINDYSINLEAVSTNFNYFFLDSKIFVFLLIVLFLITLRTKFSKNEILISLALILFIWSATLVGTFYASNMHATEKAEMWWQVINLNKLLLIMFFTIIFLGTIDKYIQQINQEPATIENKFFAVAIIFLFSLSLLHQTVSNHWQRMMPTETFDNVTERPIIDCAEVVKANEAYLNLFLIKHKNFGKQIINSCSQYYNIESLTTPVYLAGFYGPEEVKNKIFRWASSQTSNVFLMHENNTRERMNFRMELTKAPCQKKVNVRIKYQKELIKIVSLTDQKTQVVLGSLPAKAYEPVFLEFVTNAKSCKVGEDDRELTYSLSVESFSN
jgi:hypothetical protein